MNAYLAARYSRREELCVYREHLKLAGIKVTARWLDGDHQVDDAGLSAEAGRAERERFALEDYQDLQAADIFIAFTEPPRSNPSRGGRHVELGMAIALRKKLHIVGPRENVFCCLPRVHVWEDWPSCLAAILSIAPKQAEAARA